MSDFENDVRNGIQAVAREAALLGAVAGLAVGIVATLIALAALT